MYAEIFLALAKVMNFTFTLERPKDNQYGALLENGTWNGMIGWGGKNACVILLAYMTGMLVRNEADISSADFTITPSRATAVDYLSAITKTHLRLHYYIRCFFSKRIADKFVRLFVRDPRDAANWTAYFRPLTTSAWLVVALFTAFIALAVAFVISVGPSEDEVRKKSCHLYNNNLCFIFSYLHLAFLTPSSWPWEALFCSEDGSRFQAKRAIESYFSS